MRLSPAGEKSCLTLFVGFNRFQLGESASVANVTPPWATVENTATKNATAITGPTHFATASIVCDATGMLSIQSVRILLVRTSRKYPCQRVIHVCGCQASKRI